ncbi:putative acetyl-CoA synthase regulator [Escherichia coli]|nr:putative acetyl-CoA synthase regulator [Escherichia coli]
MITRIPRSSFSANINNTAQTNEHQTLSELFYKELEDKFSGKELATPLLKASQRTVDKMVVISLATRILSLIFHVRLTS